MGSPGSHPPLGLGQPVFFADVEDVELTDEEVRGRDKGRLRLELDELAKSRRVRAQQRRLERDRLCTSIRTSNRRVCGWGPIGGRVGRGWIGVVTLVAVSMSSRSSSRSRMVASPHATARRISSTVEVHLHATPPQPRETVRAVRGGA